MINNRGDSLHRNEVLHIASLTNDTLLVHILVAIKSLGNEAKKWLLTSSAGQHRFIHIAQRAAQAELFSSDWANEFKEAMTNAEKEDNGNEKALVPEMSTGELLKIARRELQPSSHKKRFIKALGMMAASPSSSSEILSVRQAADLVKASVEVEDNVSFDIQKPMFQHFLSTLPNAQALDALVAIQLPLLKRIVPSVLESALHVSLLDYRLAKLFRDTDEVQRNPITKENLSHLDASLKVLRFVEAADLARSGNQIGSKHGCVICVPHKIICENDDILQKVLEKDGCDQMYVESMSRQAPSSFAYVIGRGWNHNVVLNGRGGKKRMIHSEVHAVADAVKKFGEDIAFKHLFPHAVIVIVELNKDTSYEDAPPCPKCDTLLRAVGIRRACHSTDRGFTQDMDLDPPNFGFLNRDTVRIPLRTVCKEIGVDFSRLRHAERTVEKKL